MKLIQTTNTTPQTVLVEDKVLIGDVDRRVCGRNNFGVTTFSKNDTNIIVNWYGYYLVNINMNISSKAQTLTMDLYANGLPVEGATVNETYLGGEVHNLSISKIVRVERTCGCNNPTLALSIVNNGQDEIKLNSVNFSIVKVE